MRIGKMKCMALLAAAALLAPIHADAAALSLQQAIDMALAQNTSLRVTQEAEEKASAELSQAKGDKGVSVSASGDVDASHSLHSNSKSGLSGNVSASLPLYSGGKLDNAIKSGELGVVSAMMDTERERQELRYNVIKAYYDALESRKTVGVRQESVDNFQAHLTNVEQLYAAGAKARIDVLRSSVELSDAKQDLIKAKNSYEVNLATLRNLLDMNREEPLTLTDDVVYVPFGHQLPSCVSYAMDHRRDILVDEYKVRQRELAVDTAKAGFRPSINASAGTNWSASLRPERDLDSSRGFSGGITAKWNIFDSGVTKAKVREAESDLRTAGLNLKKSREDIDLSVRQSYFNMREAEERMNSTQHAVNEAREDYNIARESYRAGEDILLDVIDAQLALSKAELNYITAQYDYARYKAQVESNMGVPLTESEMRAAGASIARDDRTNDEILKGGVRRAGATVDASKDVTSQKTVEKAVSNVTPVDTSATAVADEAAANGGAQG